MRRLLYLFIIVVYAASLTGCNSSGGGSEEGGSGYSAAVPSDSLVTLSFNPGDMYAAMNNAGQDVMLAKIIDFITMTKTVYAALLYDYITSLSILVTADDMSDITHAEVIDNPSVSFDVSMTIPNGLNRKFAIDLKDREGNILYSGELEIDVGDYQGTPQDITVDVSIDEGVSADDYVTIGRRHLESLKLEQAFIAFDTAVCMDADHYVANFFRGFTNLMLLVQKDDPNADTASPNVHITEMLNLYSGIDDIYSHTITPKDGGIDYDIIPDIYNEDWGENFGNFINDDWTCPAGVLTDTAVNLIESTILPELDNAIADLAKAEADPVFYTTFTPTMHFELSDTIEADRGDIYILSAIAYGLKAYYNHLLAYQWRTDVDYWKDKLDPAEGDTYYGIQDAIDNDPAVPNEEVFDFTGGADGYLNAAKTAYSNGLDKLKAGLQFIDARSSVNKEGHILNIADNDLNISKIITNLDEAKAALSTAIDFTDYYDYNDTSEGFDVIRADLSIPFSSGTAPSKDTLPEFYYHVKSDFDLPIFDTNNLASSNNFVDVLTSGLISIEGEYIETLEDILENELVPDKYKFDVVDQTIPMTGYLSDFTDMNINPVMFDSEDSGKPVEFDLTKVYITGDNDYLYLGMKLAGNPYPDSLANGEYINYNVKFNAAYDDCGWYDAPVIINLHSYTDDVTTDTWEWHLFSHGEDKGVIVDTAEWGFAYEITGDIIELKIPLNYIKDRIDDYQQTEFPAPAGWDEEEIFIGVNLDSHISSDYWYDSASVCLANLEN